MRCACIWRHNEQQIWEMGDLVPTSQVPTSHTMQDLTPTVLTLYLQGDARGRL